MNDIHGHCVCGAVHIIIKAMSRYRADIKIGARVNIVLKSDQRTGKLTEGTVAKLLTKSGFHPHGIKVMLSDGQVGRVREILE